MNQLLVPHRRLLYLAGQSALISVRGAAIVRIQQGGCAMAHVEQWERPGLEEHVWVDVEDRIRVVMHEIRQPLAAVLALAEAARGLDTVHDDVCSYLDQIVGQVQEVSDAAWSVLCEDGDDTSPVDVDEVLDSVVDAFALTWGGTLIRTGDRGGLVTSGSRSTIRRCLVNVIDNAVRAAGPDGHVVVSLQRGPRTIDVLVEDDGPGPGRVPAGSGIGLRVTRRALRALGGSLSLCPGEAGEGTRVSLSLPVRPHESGHWGSR